VSDSRQAPEHSKSSYGSLTELDAKILTKRLKVRTHDSNALFGKVMLSNQLHQKALHILESLLFLSCRVSLAEYIRVLRVYPTMLQVKSSVC